MVPVRKPLPRGLYATIAVPDSLQASNSEALPFSPCSMSRIQGEYSICTAVIWWTLLARLNVSTETSDSPMFLILPSLFDVSLWISPHTGREVLLLQLHHDFERFLDWRLSINAMAVIQIDIICLHLFEAALDRRSKIFRITSE